MPDLTDNHELQLWAAGELDWQHRDDMQALDTAAEIRDFEANLSGYTPKSGAKFLATDSKAVYLGDGSVWNKIGTITDVAEAYDGTGTLIGSYTELQTGTNLSGSVSGERLTLDASGSDGTINVQDSGGTAASADTLDFVTDLSASVTDGTATIDSTAASSGDGSHRWIDVTSSTYGADPTGASDSAPAIQDAIDDAGPGGTVFIPGGEYLIQDGYQETNRGIVMNDTHNGVTVIGEGYETVLNGGGTSTFMFRIDANNPIYNITVRDIRFRNADFANLTAHQDAPSGSRGILLQNIWTHDGDRGVQVATNGAVLDGCRAWNNTHMGISFSGHNDYTEGDYHHYRCGNNLIAWDNTNSNGEPFGIDLSKQNATVSNFISINNDRGMKISNDSHRLQLTNGFLIDNGGHGFQSINTDPWGPYRYDNVVATGNGHETDTNKSNAGDEAGFYFAGGEHQIGNLYSADNVSYGIQCEGASEVAASNIRCEGNGSAAIRDNSLGFVDIMHYEGGATVDTGADGGSLWVLRSHSMTGTHVVYEG